MLYVSISYNVKIITFCCDMVSLKEEMNVYYSSYLINNNNVYFDYFYCKLKRTDNINSLNCFGAS